MSAIIDFHRQFVALSLLLPYVTIVRCAECPLENANGVTWLPVQTINASDADQRHASTPWCLNDRLYLETRQCVDDNPDAPTGSWLPAKAPDCAVVRQPAEAYHCPIGMDQLRPGSASQAPLCVRLHQVSGGWPSAAAECARLGTERTLLRLDVEEMRLVREYEMWRDNEVFLPAEWIEPHRLRWQLAGQTGGLVEELSARAVGQVARPGNGCAAMRMPDKEDIQEKQAAMEGMVENDIITTDWSHLLSKRSCNDSLPMLCVYAEPTPLMRLACPPNRWTLRYAHDNNQSQCYGVERPLASESAQQQQQLFKMTNIQQTAVGQLLRDMESIGEQNCSFDGIGDAKRRYSNVSTDEWAKAVATDPTSPLWYVNWDIQHDFSGQPLFDQHLVCDRQGRWSLADNFACVMVADDLSAVGPPTLELQLGTSMETGAMQLILQVYYPGELWRTGREVGQTDDAGDGSAGGVTCFRSDVRHEDIGTVAIGNVTELIDKSHTNYTLALVDGGLAPGLYWCEAFTVPPAMQRISTGQPLYIDRPDEIVGTVWRQVYITNATVDMADWLLVALRIAGHSTTIRLDAVTVRSVLAVRRNDADFLLIAFRAACTFITGVPFEPVEELLQFTDREILRVSAKIGLVLSALRMAPFYYPVLNSTEFCLPEVRSTSNWTLWPGGRLGEQHTSTGICWVTITGRPALRKCTGNAVDGAMWMDVTRTPCLPNVQVSALTQALHDASVSFRTQDQTREMMRSVQQLVAKDGGRVEADVGDAPDELRAFDVITIGNIMDRAAALNRENALEATVLGDVLDIYDNLMAIDAARTLEAAAVNATNLLLVALDAMLGNVSPDTDAEGQRRQHFQVHWLDPRATNVSGVALYEGGLVRYLYANQSAEELLAERTLLVAAVLPEALLAALPPLSKVLMGISDSEVLFQSGDQDEPSDHQLLSRHIISITIPNVDTSALPSPVHLFFGCDPTIVDDTTNNIAAGTYWPLDNRRSWSPSGIQHVANSTHVVQFSATHLTNFAYIVRDNIQFSAQDSAALFVVTVVGSALSLTGIVGIFLTALRFSKWRSKASNQLLLQLSAAIAGMLLLFLFADNRLALANREVCITMGAVLHYMVLVTFMWMLVMAYLQFMRYVVVFVQMRSDRYVLKLSCVGWLVPMVPVGVVLLVNPNLYLPLVDSVDGADSRSDADGSMCYPTGYALYGGLLAPIGVIIVCNVLVFVSVIYNVLQVQMTNRSIVLAQLRVSSFLFFLLGLTWIFGFFSRGEGPSLLFAYLFCATATLQGLVLFVYFVLLEPGTRQMWTNDIRTVCGIRRRGSMTVVMNA